MQLNTIIEKKSKKFKFDMIRTAILSTLFIFISLFTQAQNNNKLYLRTEAGGMFNNKLKTIELPKQMMVNWYDTSGHEHNEDKVLLFVKDDTLYFDVPQNDTLVEAIAYNQIEYIRIFSVGKILLIPVAIYSSAIFAYGAVGAVALIGYGLTSSNSYFGGPSVAILGLIVAAIDIPIFIITKALWNGTRMTYKTNKWKLLKR
jgi:hypothetical protein